MTARVLLMKTGDSPENVQPLRGDYDRIFTGHLEGLDVRVDTRQVHRGDPLPDASTVDGVIITGSGSSVTEPEPWVATASEWLVDAIGSGTPVLGVCYGHQLIAAACGGRVERNPLGYELGTIEVELTDAGRQDPLFAALEPPFRFGAVHGDAVTELPDGATLLAKNALGIQAYAIGESVRCVQFHPEFDPELVKLMVDARGENVRAEALERGADPEQALEAVYASVDRPQQGRLVLRGFVERFVP